MRDKIELKNVVLILEDILQETTKHKHYSSPKARNETIINNPLIVVLIDFIVRFQSNLNLIGIVIDGANEASDLAALEHSIGIVLRNCLSDCITVREVIHYLDEEEGYSSKEKQKEIYLAINTDQLRILIQRLELIKKSGLKLNSNPNLDNVINHLVDHYAEYFSDTKTRKFKISKKRTVLSTIAWINQSKRYKYDAVEILELWEHYSRYEHYGPIYYELLKMPLKENWNRMIWVLIYSCRSISEIFNCIKTPETKATSDFIEGKIELLSQERVR